MPTADTLAEWSLRFLPFPRIDPMSSPKLLTKTPSDPLPVAGAREFEYTQRDFEAVRNLIYRRAGISLSPQKMDMVYSRLARRLRATGTKRFEDYLALLRHGNETEWEAFTNALTTNLTSFFREQHHFPILAILRCAGGGSW